jgi:hypothetical protein
MLNQTGTRNISCSVVRSHLIRNGCATFLGSNVVLIKHRPARLGGLSAWLCLESSKCTSKDLQRTNGRFGESTSSTRMTAYVKGCPISARHR